MAGTAPTLVSAGLDIEQLDTLADNIAADLSNVLIWLEATLAATGLINEIDRYRTHLRVGEKQLGYSYMDQGPLRI